MKVQIAKTSKRMIMLTAIIPLPFVLLLVVFMVSFQSSTTSASIYVVYSLGIAACLALSITFFVMYSIRPEDVLVFDRETGTIEYHISKKRVSYIAVYDIESIGTKKGRNAWGDGASGFLIIRTKSQGKFMIGYVDEVDIVVDKIDRIRFGCF